jgi:type IV fimbrial biogenesis protein FimT
VTVVELMVTLAILAVLLAVALPSMRDFIARKRLEGTAQELLSDLRLLKSLPPKPTYPASIKFGSNSALTCYALYLRGPGGRGDGSCDCTLAPGLECGVAGVGAPELIRVISVPRSSGITISASRATTVLAVGNDGMPVNDLSLAATLEGSGVGSIRVNTNALFVPSMCSVSGAFGSIRPCP